MRTEEEWRDIPGYEGIYKISSLGNIFSAKRNKNLKPQPAHHGYLRIQLRNNEGGGFKSYAVHRLVALAFIPNPNRYPEINHINGKTGDNRVENLEWCTRAYNVRFGNRLDKFKKRIKQLGKDGKLLAVYSSMSEAALVTGARQGAISNACLGRTKTAGGYKWKFV